MWREEVPATILGTDITNNRLDRTACMQKKREICRGEVGTISDLRLKCLGICNTAAAATIAI